MGEAIKSFITCGSLADDQAQSLHSPLKPVNFFTEEGHLEGDHLHQAMLNNEYIRLLVTKEPSLNVNFLSPK